MKKSFIKGFPLLLTGLILFTACSDKDTPGPGEAPVMPPASSMEPDFSYFSGEDNPDGRVDVVGHWLYAATNVTIYSALLKGALSVPVTAYKVALTQDVEFDSELGAWVWDYDINVGTAGQFQVRLLAEVNGEEVQWTGDISKAGVFQNFVWFEGTSQVNGESGSWTLYESYANATPWLSAEWTRSDVEEKADVTFTVEKQGDGFGSSISYEASVDGTFNRGVTIVDTNTQNTIVVNWHSETKVGQVKSPAYFGDDTFRCWDGNLLDTDCN